MKNSLTYQTNLKSAQQGLLVLKEFEEKSKNAYDVSEQFLLKLIKDNKDTEYGKKYHFSDICTVNDYQKLVPIITYEDIQKDINRMMMGETNILTTYPYKHFSVTSATVGKAKAIPMTDIQSSVFMKYGNLYNQGIMEKYLNPLWKEGKSFSPTEGTYSILPSGYTLGCASSKMAEACIKGIEPYGSMLKAMYSSPAEAMIPDGYTNTKYLHIRFALMEKDLTGITAAFPVTLVHLMTYLKDNYELLINDIEKGTIDESINISEEKLFTLKNKLIPMPERAKELKEIFKNGANFQFMPLVWPKMQYILCAFGDGLTVYNDILNKYFHGGKIHQICTGVTASEGQWSVCSGIDDPDGIIVPDGCYIEFLPVEAENDYSKIVTMKDVKLGHVYELIITNLSGLYRYRMSDAVKITGFYNLLPKCQFMYRVNKTISLALEKTTEDAIHQTVTNTANRLGFSLFDYEVYPDQKSVPGKYVFLIETYDDIRFKISNEELANVIYEELIKANPRVLAAAKSNSIGKLEAYFEQPETQLLYRDKQIMMGLNAQQIKPVHIISNEEQRKFFMTMRESR